MDNYKGELMLQRADELFKSTGSNIESNQPNGLTLFENVQFIYELALAEMELSALGVNFEATNGLRKFDLKGQNDIEKIRKRVAYFDNIDGLSTDYSKITKMNVTRSVNQYLTHWIYPYKGKFHPQMIRALVNILGLNAGDTLLEPFSGSGTTAIEAQLLGVNIIGVDISPLCVLQGKVKTESVEVLSGILETKSKVLESLNMLDSNRVKLDDAINNIKDEKVRNFYKMAKLVAISDNVRRNRELNESFKRNLELMIASVKYYTDIVDMLKLKLGSIDIKEGDARHLKLKDSSMDGIITSPPYSIALDYVSNDSHALEALGYDTKKIRDEFIGVRGSGTGKVMLYDKDMELCLGEMYRVLKPNKMAAIVIGNAMYQGKEVRTVEFIERYAKKLGFVEVKNINKIIFGLYNVMKKESILIFRKA